MSEVEQQYLVMTREITSKKEKKNKVTRCVHAFGKCLEQVPESAAVCEIYFCAAIGHIGT